MTTKRAKKSNMGAYDTCCPGAPGAWGGGGKRGEGERNRKFALFSQKQVAKVDWAEVLDRRWSRKLGREEGFNDLKLPDSIL